MDAALPTVRMSLPAPRARPLVPVTVRAPSTVRVSALAPPVRVGVSSELPASIRSVAPSMVTAVVTVAAEGSPVSPRFSVPPFTVMLWTSMSPVIVQVPASFLMMSLKFVMLVEARVPLPEVPSRMRVSSPVPPSSAPVWVPPMVRVTVSLPAPIEMSPTTEPVAPMVRLSMPSPSETVAVRVPSTVTASGPVPPVRVGAVRELPSATLRAVPSMIIDVVASISAVAPLPMLSVPATTPMVS